MSESSPRKPGLIVFACGIGFSALVLRGVDWLNDHGENIMGWYGNGFIPVGALIVGLASGLGYAVASRYLNAKLSKTFVWGMVLTAVLDYVAAQYVTYTSLLERHHASAARYSFGQYIKEICEGMSFTRSSSHEPGAPLGKFGYVYKVLEMAGFVGGYIIPSMVLFFTPYCRGCQLYLKKHQKAFLNSGMRTADVRAMKKAQRLEAIQKAVKDIGARGLQVVESIRTASLPETETALHACELAHDPKAVAFVSFNLKKCPSCSAHHLNVMVTHATGDKKVSSTKLAVLDKTAAPAAAL